VATFQKRIEGKIHRTNLTPKTKKINNEKNSGTIKPAIIIKADIMPINFGIDFSNIS
jgi:hypothetical protein